jgi:hypothetical protein
MNGIGDECIDPVRCDTRDDCGAAEAEGADSLPKAVARRLTQYHVHRRTLFAWIHPERIAKIAAVSRLPDLGERQLAALAEAFLDAVGMPTAPLESFVCAGAELALLPAQDCLRVFRLRALLQYSVVHSWIDKPRRARLHDWVGPHGSRLLLSQRRNLGGGDPAADASAEGTLLHTESADTLAWRGFGLLARECGWHAQGPVSLAQLALPEAVTRARSLQDADFDRRAALSAATSPSMAIVSQLPQLFPEWTW